MSLVFGKVAGVPVRSFSFSELDVGEDVLFTADQKAMLIKALTLISQTDMGAKMLYELSAREQNLDIYSTTVISKNGVREYVAPFQAHGGSVAQFA